MALDGISVAAAMALAALGQGGGNCDQKPGCSGTVQVRHDDRTTAALSLGAFTFNRIDVAPLLAQRPLRGGVDDPARDGRAPVWNSGNPDAMTDRHAAAYGAAGQEGAVILVHAGPRHIVAINPFAAVESRTADGQPMPAELVRRLESARSAWLNENGYTGGVRTFVNDAAPKAEHKDAAAIQPRGVIQLNPEVTRFKSRMQVHAPCVKVVPVIASTIAPKAPEQAKPEAERVASR